MSEASGSERPTVRVFGGIAVHDADGPVGIGGQRQRRLLALLVLEPGRVLSADALAEDLWNDDDRPAVAGPALRTYVSRLRRALPPPADSWIETQPGGYAFTGPRQSVEHTRFQDLRAEARKARESGEPEEANRLLAEARSLWRGEPLPELDDVESARAALERLRLDLLEVHEEHWEAALALGRHTQITGELGAFTTDHVLRDRAVRQYALALYRAGQVPDSLRAIDRHRQALLDASGLDPSAAMLELEQSILAGDPALDIREPGLPLRGYRLLEEAGVGAFSIVWRGLQPSVDREVAIKQIRSELASQPDFVRRFEAEAHLVARIEHPHIVPLIDFWRDPDSAYLVMRWLPGGTLERRLDNGPLPVDATIRLARQVGEALAAAHRHDVVHRDVKTANILFDAEGNAFLSDFGIALETSRSAGPEAALSPGSPGYAAPEQVQREPLTPAADVYSLGVVIYECLVGSLPTVGQDLVSLGELRRDIPSELASAVERALRLQPGDRFASATEFVAALDATQQATESRHERPPTVDNPYLGLRPFDEADATIFFGRERLVREIVDQLGGHGPASRLVAVIGPSGSGKSSVVRAGVIPALRSGALPDAETWFVTTMTPGANPFESLESALLRVAVGPPDDLGKQLRSGDRGVLRAVRGCVDSDDRRVLLVIDQFEELYTVGQDDLATGFLDALAVAVADPTSPLRLVVTLRADYYDRPLNHSTFAPLLKAAAVEVTPLHPDELEAAVTGPAVLVGATFESGLVARILTDTAGRPGPLPLLQHALRELFEQRSGETLTVASYEELGGIRSALAGRAEQLYDDSDGPARAEIRRVFGRLVRVDTERPVRQRALVSELGLATGSTVLERYGEARLLSFDHDDATRAPVVEMSHEALLDGWPRLEAWLDEDRDLLRTVASLGAASDRWVTSGRSDDDLLRGRRLEEARSLVASEPERCRPVDRELVEASSVAADSEVRSERRRIRRLRQLLGVVCAALLIAVIAGGFFLRSRDDAQSAQREAEQASAEAASAQAAAEESQRDAEQATLVSQSSAQIAQDPELALLLALEAHGRSPDSASQGAVLAALGASALAQRESSLPPVFDDTSVCPPTERLSEDGSAVFYVEAGTLTSLDPLTGSITGHGPAPEQCGFWFFDDRAGVRWFSNLDGDRHWFGSVDGPWSAETELDVPHYLFYRAAGDGERLPFVVPKDDGAEIRILDGRTGDPVGDPITAGVDLVAGDLSPDKRLLAFGFFSPANPDGDGIIVVVDPRSGAEIARLPSQQPASAFTFGPHQGQMVAGLVDGTLLVVELESAAVVDRRTTAATTGFFNLVFGEGGTLQGASRGQVQFVDLEGADPGRVVELRDAVRGRFRPDGLLSVQRSDGSLEVLRIGDSALVEDRHEVDPFAFVQIADGRAAALRLPDGRPTLVDLGDGQRVELDVPSVADDDSGVLAVLPDGDGYITIDQTDVLRRWQNGEAASTLALVARPNRIVREGDYLGITIPIGGARGQVLVVDRSAEELVATFDTTLEEPEFAHPTANGGLLVVSFDGTVTLLDPTGATDETIATGVSAPQATALDLGSGRLAVSAENGGVVIVDPGASSVEDVPITGVAAMGFGRNGELLVLTGFDGDVRLWDVERRRFVGLAWDGSGARSGSASWYDEATRSIWVNTSGELLRIPLDPEDWIARACEVVGRELTQLERDQYVPGAREPVPVCP